MITAICRGYTDFRVEMSWDEITNEGASPGAWDRDRINTIIEKYSDRGRFIPGGSMSNALSQVAHLGGQAAFIGKLADDVMGQRFSADLAARGIKYSTPFETSVTGAQGSPVCIIIVDPAGERIMGSHRGVVDELTVEDLEANKDILAESKVIAVTDIIREREKHDLFRAILRHKARDSKIAVSLQTMRMQTPSDEAAQVITHANIVFGNEEEFDAFLNLLGYVDDLETLSQSMPTRIFIRTLADKGAELYANGGEHYWTPAIEGPVKDTVGAGDAFAGGFLHAYQENPEDLQACLVQGTKSARNILNQEGGRPMIIAPLLPPPTPPAFKL